MSGLPSGLLVGFAVLLSAVVGIFGGRWVLFALRPVGAGVLVLVASPFGFLWLVGWFFAGHHSCYRAGACLGVVFVGGVPLACSLHRLFRFWRFAAWLSAFRSRQALYLKAFSVVVLHC